MINSYSHLLTSYIQGTRRLKSQDRIWILTDIEVFYSRYYGCSPEQQWFKVGAVDLATMELGYFEFGRDDARVMLMAGLPIAPWEHSLPEGISLSRGNLSHGGGGRRKEAATLIHLDSELLALGPKLRRRFCHAGHYPSFTADMWEDIAGRVALTKRVREVALSMDREFSAGDMQAVVGDVNVSHILTEMVRLKLLKRTGQKRGTRYTVLPPKTIERADWVA